MGGQAHEQRVQRVALAGVERSQELVLEPAHDRAQLGERLAAVGRHLDDVAAAVFRVALSHHQVALLELVQQSHDVASVVAERVGDRRLRLARVLLEQRQHGEVERAEPGALECAVRVILGREAESLQQEGRAREQLLGRAGHHRRSHDMGFRHVHHLEV